MKKARIAVRVAKSKAAKALRQLGVADREEERKRKKFIKEQLVKQGRGIVALIPPYILILIRDRQKEQTPTEAEVIRIAN